MYIGFSALCVLLRAHSLSCSLPTKFFSSLLAAAAASSSSSSSQHKSAIVGGVVCVDDNSDDGDDDDISLITTVVLSCSKQQSQSINSSRRRHALGSRCFRSLSLCLLNPQSKFANNQRSYQCCLAMVCKENVVSWFSSLSSYKRIDVMCTLLNMCLPFEIRYFGTVVEDLGKRDYNVLRDTEHRANNVSDLTELTNLGMTDKRTRRKLALYTALLHSCSHSCAEVLYKILSNLDFQEIQSLANGTNCSSDERPLEELLLLYTMAVSHPAFNYEQKSTFGNLLLKLKTENKSLKDSTSDSLSFKSQNCIPCTNQNDRIDTDISTNIVAPPPMQAFQGDMQMRNNAIMSGVPPGGMSLASPGLCPIPSPEQMSMPPPGHPLVHVSFPTVQPMQPWAAQMLMGQNQFMYQPSENSIIYSPSGSQQSSPTHSQAHSRSNSPIGHMQQQRKNNSNNNNNASSNGPQQHQPRTSSQITQPTSNILTTSTSTSSTQTTSSTALGTAVSLPPLSSISTSRNQSIISGRPRMQPLMPSVARPPFVSMSSHQQQWQHNNNLESTLINSTPTVTSKQQQRQQPPPPRLKPTLSGESLRESGNKEMPNFKGNFQNASNNEIKRLSDENISKSDLTSNALNNIKTQTANGLTQTPEKKIEGPVNVHSTNESIENESMENVVVDNSIVKPPTIPDPAIINYHQPNPAAMPNMRRYPPQMDPAHMQMFSHHAMYPAQNPCYQCNLGIPVLQNRYARNPTALYCLTTNLQALRLDPENNRNSQSSSSDSTGSRSPPETPPAVPWMGTDLNSTPVPTVVEQQQQQQQHMTNVPPPLHSIPSSQERRLSRKNQNHLIRQKNHSSSMVNGVVPPPQQQQPQQPPQQQQQQQQQVPSPAVTGFQVSPSGYVPHHFTGLRPAATGIYSNFTPAYARPGYPIAAAAAAYQHNGEMMYQYPTHPPPGSTATGTPPPPPATVQTSQPPPQQPQPNFAQPPPLQPTPVAYAPVNVPPPHIPPKISCYNCGSSMHLAADCSEQTMEDITRRASYRLDYSTTKPTAGSGDQQNQSSDK